MEAQNPTVRLMEAVRYGHACGLTALDMTETVQATLQEPGIKFEPVVCTCKMIPNSRIIKIDDRCSFHGAAVPVSS